LGRIIFVYATGGTSIGADLVNCGAGVVGGFVAVAVCAAGKAMAGNSGESEVPPLGIASTTLLLAAIVLVPALPLTLPSAWPSLPIIGVIVGLSLFSTAIASIIYLRLIHQIGATKVLTVTYLIPLFAMLWGRLFLQEPTMALGCGLILCGTAIANR
jgi:drug/metabolite transporter (DMT)-like permease